MPIELLIAGNSLHQFCFSFFPSSHLSILLWFVLTELWSCSTILPRAKFNENCTISSKQPCVTILNQCFIPKIFSSGNHISLVVLKSILETYFPVSAHIRRMGKWMLHIKLCQVPDELSFRLGSALYAPAPVSPDCTILWSPDSFL